MFRVFKNPLQGFGGLEGVYGLKLEFSWEGCWIKWKALFNIRSKAANSCIQFCFSCLDIGRFIGICILITLLSFQIVAWGQQRDAEQLFYARTMA